MGTAMEDPMRWDTTKVANWLERSGMPHLVANFRRNCINGEALLGMEKKDLKDELEIPSLQDRKLVWDKITNLKTLRAHQGHRSPPPPRASQLRSTPPPSRTPPRSDRESPLYVPASNPAPGPERCEHCNKTFALAEAPVLLTLPGAARAVRVHKNCKETWAYNNAKLCRECKRPMTTDITVLTGSFGKAEVHPECVSFYERRHQGGTAAAHSAPAAREERARSPAHPSASVFSEVKLGTCDHCQEGFTARDRPIKLTLPGSDVSAELHPHCKTAWSERHAQKCDLCKLPMPTDVTTLTGSFGAAHVHPHCVPEFEMQLRSGSVPGSAGSGSPSSSTSPRRAGGSPAPTSGSGGSSGRCEYCHKAFTEFDTAILLTLPGASRAAELHASCKTSWSKLHAKLCEYCREPMIRDITTLSGKWGKAELHPDCVKGFESKVLQTSGTADRCAHCQLSFRDGEVATVVTLPGETRAAKLHPACQKPWSMLSAKLCTHCSKPMPTDVTTLTGVWGKAELHPECIAGFKESLANGTVPQHRLRDSANTKPESPVSSSRCYRCKISFRTNEPVTVLNVNEVSHDVHLHNHCVDGFHRDLGHVCSWCKLTITGHMTKLKGGFGSATLHPDCLQPFKTAKNLA